LQGLCPFSPGHDKAEVASTGKRTCAAHPHRPGRQRKAFFINLEWNHSMQRLKRTAVLIRSTLVAALLLQGAGSFADDTEIFLSRGQSDVKPNVFFILDDSDSMKWCLDKDLRSPDPKKKTGRCPDGSFKNRAEVLQEALNQLLSQMKDVRFGMMWMNNREGTGLPVDDIDKVRGKALELINQTRTFTKKTPIDRSLYDAARYFNGFPKGGYPGNRNFPGRSGIEPFHPKGAKDTKDMASPIIDACQPSHIVLLTDGDAWYDDISGKTMELIGRKNACAEQPGASSKLAERCVPELAEWLHNKDQMPDPLHGNQTVNVHTIALALNSVKDANPVKVAKRKQFLTNIASSGGGKYYAAEDSKQLLDAFQEIVQQAMQVDSATFVNPAAAPSTGERVSDQYYYALFQPSGTDRWAGNLKRYRFSSKSVLKNGKKQQEAVIYDVNNQEALDSNGAFQEQAQSFWSSAPDGPNINQGGAAWQLPEPGKRKILVEVNGVLGKLKPENPAISKELLGAVDNKERKALLNYIRGFSDDGSSARSKALGDFLHSAPVAFRYGPEESGQMIIIGSNEGFVHLFNRKSGIEEFAFMPGELLGNIKRLKDNRSSTPDKPHPYGVDNTVTLWQQKNPEGKIEHTYAYITLRRGGRSLYALDISKRDNPELLWKIQGGEGDFQRLGQTWSRPVKGQIKIADKIRDVLIFAGGYDPSEDAFSGGRGGYRSDEALGNALYIVDARTGSKLWSASKSGSNLNLADMKYSIPSAVSVLDIDNDGLIDQLFVGDTGGQIWRLFIHQGGFGNSLVSARSAQGTSGNQPFARLGKNNPQEARRFYQDVDIVPDKKAQRIFINIGSGYRAHPLDQGVNDRFYSLRAKPDENPFVPLTENDLHQATRSFAHFDQEQTITAINQKQGWYMPLTLGKGEKVLSSSLTLSGELYFNTYVPSADRIGCQVTLGSNYTYRLRLDSAAPPPLPLHQQPAGVGGGVSLLLQPLYYKLATVGIAARPTVFDTEEGTFICTSADSCKKLSISPCQNPKGCKTFWMDFEG